MRRLYEEGKKDVKNIIGGENLFYALSMFKSGVIFEWMNYKCIYVYNAFKSLYINLDYINNNSTIIIKLIILLLLLSLMLLLLLLLLLLLFSM